MSGVQTTSPRPLPVVASPAPTAGTTPFPMAPSSADEELRKSNGMAGHKYNRVWAVFWLLRLALILPLVPLWPFLLAYEARDWSIARNYFGTMAYVGKTLLVHLKFGSISRVIKYNLLIGPEEFKKRIAKRRGACTRCAKCCKQFNCVFLGEDTETKEYYCKVFGTDYWYYGTCGRYPLDQKDIDDHACPGFYFPDEEEAKAEAATV